MNLVRKIFRLGRSTRLAILLCSALLVSCGDSFTTAGIGGTGISYGSVTDFGSIILNGSRLDDSTAIVTLDDNPGIGTHGGLKQGMVVKVTGTFDGNTGTAESIEYRDNLEGRVCAALAAPIVPPIVGIKTLRVLGQTVILDAITIVDNNDQINLGDIIEVSGLPNDQEEIHASFIEVKNPVPFEVEVKGFVDTVDPIAKVLTINALDVNFSGIGVIDNSIPGGMPAEGQFVEVKGTIFACGTPDTLTATKVELEPEGAGAIPDGVHAEVEGFVTTALNPPGGPGSFMIGSREVVITGSTRFLPEGFDETHIELGTKLEAEGTSSNGVLTATKISFRENVRFEANVATVGSNSFTLVGFPSISITTNSATEPFGVIVNLNDPVRVRGIEGPGNTVLATRVDIQSNSSSDSFMQGAVDTKVGNDIWVLGIKVDTTGISDTPISNSKFKDTEEMPVSRATFLSLVQPGTVVKFKGLAGPLILWDEAELEDD